MAKEISGSQQNKERDLMGKPTGFIEYLNVKKGKSVTPLKRYSNWKEYST